VDQPESWNQAPTRASEHHCDSGHSSPKPDGSKRKRRAIPMKVSSMEQPAESGCRLLTSMAVNHPRTTAGTRRTQSFKLIFAKLDRGASPKPSRLIKPLYFGLHDATAPARLTNARTHASHHTSQRYTHRFHQRLSLTPIQRRSAHDRVSNEFAGTFLDVTTTLHGIGPILGKAARCHNR
jgi:hypothetical protein